MSDQVVIEVGELRFPNIWLGRDEDEEVELLSERSSLEVGQKVTLTNGMRGVVLDNLREKLTLVVGTPQAGAKLCIGSRVSFVPYHLVRSERWGHSVIYREFLKSEGVEGLNKAILSKDWQSACHLLTVLSDSVEKVVLKEYARTILTEMDEEGEEFMGEEECREVCNSLLGLAQSTQVKQ